MSTLSSTLAERELCTSQAWLIRLRWFAGLGVIVAIGVASQLLGLGLATTPLYAIGLTILGYNTLFWQRLRYLQCDLTGASAEALALARWQITADWIAMTLLIHFSGGVESPAILYFFFHIILAALLLSAQATYGFAALATVLVGGLALLEYLGLLPHVSVVGFLPGPLYRQPFYVGGVIFFFVSTIFASAYLATGLAGRLRRREAEVVALSQQLSYAYGRQQILYESAQTVSSTLELQQVLDRLTRGATEAMKVRGCSIRLLDATGTRLYIASAYGLSADYINKGDLQLDRNPLAREVLSGKPVVVDDVTADGRLQYQAESKAEGIRSTLSVPLWGRGGPLGLLRVYCTRPYRFSADDITFLTAIAHHGSIALENALAYQALQHLDEAKRKFVLMVTHELRSPVSVVRSLLRTLAGGYAGALTPTQQDMIARALRRSDFLQTLIDDLLDMAAGKTGLREEEPLTPVGVTELVKRVVERYRTPAAEKQIALTLTLDPTASSSLVLATAAGLDRLFNNLISNALKYTAEGGQVTVAVSQSPGQIGIEISDTGIGIPEEGLQHLFEEFYRAPNAKALVREGTGLGLVIVKDLVTRYGGQIQVRSAVGVGTTFAITLPLAPA